LEQLINLDKELFLFLNGLGSEPFDGFWMIITKQINWVPIFITTFYFAYVIRKVGSCIEFLKYFFFFLFWPIGILTLLYWFFKYSYYKDGVFLQKVRNIFIVIIFLAALITFTDQLTNLFKYSFERLRPCNNPEFDGIMRKVITRKSFSFFSGHASNSFASTTFIVLILRNYYKHTYLLFLFPLIFAYSRIYLGLHYPGDILTGYVFGATFGFVFYKLYVFLLPKLS
jgi:undecaprenyl-diphosphatase